MSSISICTLGMFSPAGTGVMVGGGGVPYDFRKDNSPQEVKKPTILVKNVEFISELKKQELSTFMSIKSIKWKDV